MRDSVDLLHRLRVRRTRRREISPLRRLASRTHKVFVLGRGHIEKPRGFRVDPEGVWGSLRDVHERASGGRYGFAIFEVKRKLSFEYIERLVVLRLNMERRSNTSWSHLLNERILTAGLFSGGFEGREGAEKP